MIPKSIYTQPSFIILDLDNTLYEYEPCHSHGISELRKFLSASLDLETETVRKGLELARMRVKERLGNTAASHSRIAYINEFIISTSIRAPLSLIARAERIYWLAYFEEMSLRQGAHEFLLFANQLNIPIYLVTDLTLNIQIEKIQKLNLEKIFTFVISSEESGGDKLTNLPFKNLTMHLDSTPEFYWAIGDKCWDFPQNFGNSCREFALEKVNCLHEHELRNFVELLQILKETTRATQKSIQL